ncbi:hypothetical protein F5X99DRAFT_365688 [Biscogniauxia marginata]|nr:hypothetical protein F5X99DRAFT_365688 [Biscogniauxia marginata]
MSIQHLPEHVIAQIKSSITITSLNGVICGLVKNALDANATKITISVDYARGNCSVEDNGLGIPPAEFKPSGGLGKLHYTSKFPARDGLHGKYGTFMASLASLSLLSVTSHHHGHHSHNSITIHNSNILARHTPSPPEQRLLSFDHGTRVTVRDLFGSMPVRVKQRAIDAERSTNTKEWDNLKRALIALILAWPGPISLSIREPTNRWSTSIRSDEASRLRSNSRGDSLDLPVRVSRILYQGQLFDDNTSETWVPLRASASSVSIVGAVSLIPIATRRIQFISIGVQPVPNEHGSNVLYEEINRLFANSSFGTEEQGSDIDEEEQKRRAKDRRYKTDGFTNQELKGRKGVDRWPMFYIKVNLEEWPSPLTGHDVDEILDERRESLSEITDLLRAVVYEFLKKHHFRPKHFRPSKKGALDPVDSQDTKNTPSRILGPKETTTPDGFPINKQSTGDLASTRLRILSNPDAKSRSESPFNLWTRIKSGRPPLTSADCNKPNERRESDYFPSRSTPGEPVAKDSDQSSPTPLFGPDGKLLRAPFSDVEDDSDDLRQHLRPPIEELGRPLGQERDKLLWTNPATTETSIIDPRTGFVVRPLRTPGEHGENHVPPIKKLRLQSRPTVKEDENTWATDLLSSWDNPVFQAAEPPIPVAFDETMALGLSTGNPKGNSHGFNATSYDTSAALHAVQGRVSKEALRNAEVIAQVDRKFIFAKVPLLDPNTKGISPLDSTASLLIIIDQHAADERCRVEALMKDYFEASDSLNVRHASPSSSYPQRILQARMEILEKPIRFDISARDAAQFERSLVHFERWGVVYEVSSLSKSKTGSPQQLRVTKLPPSIAERCRLEPRLLIELLRKEAWKLHEHGHEITQTPKLHVGNMEDEERAISSWLARFHGCPQGILDMINSRACRSSIMFNDNLTHEGCVELLSRLADCAFPFQCAHGRPSMVPLVDLGHSSMNNIADQQNRGHSFGKEFRMWASKRSCLNA